jgi:hypothetical protein
MTTYKLQFEGLGFSEDAAKALIEAGLDSFVEIASLMEDDASSLLRSLRKPGGGAKGMEILFLSEKHLKTIVFGFRHQLYCTDVYSETDVTKSNADMWQYTSLRTTRTLRMNSTSRTMETTGPRSFKNWMLTLDSSIRN